MSVNPLLAQDSAANGEVTPMPLRGETFLLSRQNVGFEAKLSSCKLTGNGKLFVSSQRMVFVKLRGGNRADFRSFEIPMETLRERPKFQQPIFGANYLEGICKMVDQNLFPGRATFSLTFNSGSCGVFLNVFYKSYSDFFWNLQNGTQASDMRTQALDMVRPGGQVAYMDPNDPSVIYVNQPQPVQGTEESTHFEASPPSAQQSTSSAAEPLLSNEEGQDRSGSYDRTSKLLNLMLVGLCVGMALGTVILYLAASTDN